VKLFAILSVFCGCVFIGLFIYCKSKMRVRFFADLLSFCGNLQTEVGFALMPVTQVIDVYRDGYSGHFRGVLSRYGDLVNSRCDITRERCRTCVWEGLTEEEKNKVADFFYNLGRHGVGEEKNKIESAAAVFGGYKGAADEYLRAKASIALKILIIMGVAGAILLL
jgi:hypothetical protein